MTDVYSLYAESPMMGKWGADKFFNDQIVEDSKSISNAGVSNKSSISAKSIEQIDSLNQQDLQSLNKVGPSITAPVRQIVKELKKDDALDQNGAFKNSPVAQELKKSLNTRVKKIKSDLKVIRQKNPQAQTIKNYKNFMKKKLQENVSTVVLPSFSEVFGDASKLSWQPASFGGPSGPKFPKLGKYVPNPMIKQFPNANVMANFGEDTFNLNNKFRTVTPLVYASEKKKADKDGRISAYIKSLQTGRMNKDDAYWTSLGPLVKWNQKQSFWQILDKKTDQRYSSFVLKDLRKNFKVDISNVMLDKQLTQQQITKYVPQMVQQLVATNLQFSQSGIGPISRTSLPFYTGRFMDKITGRVRVLPTPTTKYLNPLSYDARISYLQARVLNNWNKFVMAQQMYLNMKAQKKQDWQKKQTASLKMALMGGQKNKQSAVKWMLNQINTYKIGLPVSQSSKIVLGTSQQIGKLAQITTQVDKLNKDPAKVTSAQLQAFAKKLQAIAATIIAKITQNDQESIKKKKKIANAYSTWMDKGYVKNADNIRKLLRTQLPMDLSAEDIAKVDEKMDQWKDVFSKADATLPQTTINDFLANKAIDVSQFAASLDQLKPKVTSTRDTYVSKFIGKTKPIQKAPKDFTKLGKQGLTFADL